MWLLTGTQEGTSMRRSLSSLLASQVPELAMWRREGTRG